MAGGGATSTRRVGWDKQVARCPTKVLSGRGEGDHGGKPMPLIMHRYSVGGVTKMK